MTQPKEYIEYIEIYAQTILNEIKENVRKNKIKISGEQEQKTDTKMLEVIKGLCQQGQKETEECLFKPLTPNNEEETKRIMRSLMQYYTALYNDNVELLKYLIANNYHFIHGESASKYPIGLFVLDKRISSKFDKELYLELLFNYSDIFHNFYISVTRSSFNTALSNEEIINIFCSILNKNHNIALIKNNEQNDEVLSHLLTKRTIVYFGEEIILNATEKQKASIIHDMAFANITPHNLERLKHLMTTHGFATRLHYDKVNEIFDELTDEELLMIDKLEGYPFFRHSYRQSKTNAEIKIDFEGLRKEIYSIQFQTQPEQEVVPAPQNKLPRKKRLRDLFTRK